MSDNHKAARLHSGVVGPKQSELSVETLEATSTIYPYVH